MDSDSTQEANRANIKAARWAFWQFIATVVIGLPTLAVLLWQQLSPGQGGGDMVKGWIPIIVISTALILSAISLLIVTFRLQRNKRLRKQVSRLEGELTTSKEEARKATLRANEETNQRNNWMELYNETKRKLGRWAWLTDTAEQQMSRISDYVKLDNISLGAMELTGLDPTVRFGVYITNKSLLDISLDYEQEAQIFGPIQFTNHKTITLRGTKVVIHTAKDIPPGGSGCLTIEQRLIDNEPKIIGDGMGWPPAKFHFAGLIVKIIGGKRSPDVTPKELEMGNATCSAFDANLLEKGQRIRALAEVRGSVIQLYEPLRTGDDPLPIEVFERWERASRSTLKEVYKDEALQRVWWRITHNNPFPNTAGSQRSWVETCMHELGAFLAELTGDYGQK